MTAKARPSRAISPRERALSMRALFMAGSTWNEIAIRYRFKNEACALKWVKRNLPDLWPIQRRPEVDHRIRSEAALRRSRAVQTLFIMEMLEEHLVANDLTMAEFLRTRLGIEKRTEMNQYYEYRARRRTRMSGDHAARILAAIGEPIRRDMVA